MLLKFDLIRTKLPCLTIGYSIIQIGIRRRAHTSDQRTQLLRIKGKFSTVQREATQTQNDL